MRSENTSPPSQDRNPCTEHPQKEKPLLDRTLRWVLNLSVSTHSMSSTDSSYDRFVPEQERLDHAESARPHSLLPSDVRRNVAERLQAVGLGTEAAILDYLKNHPVLNRHISSIGLEIRFSNAVEKFLGTTRVLHLMVCTQEELLAIPNFGKKARDQVVQICLALRDKDLAATEEKQIRAALEAQRIAEGSVKSIKGMMGNPPPDESDPYEDDDAPDDDCTVPIIFSTLDVMIHQPYRSHADERHARKLAQLARKAKDLLGPPWENPRLAEEVATRLLEAAASIDCTEDPAHLEPHVDAIRKVAEQIKQEVDNPPLP